MSKENFVMTFKEAAELYRKYPPGTGIDCTAEFERFAHAREMLAAFAPELLEIVEQLVYRFPDLGELLARGPGERNHAAELIFNARAALAKLGKDI